MRAWRCRSAAVPRRGQEECGTPLAGTEDERYPRLPLSHAVTFGLARKLATPDRDTNVGEARTSPADRENRSV